MASKVNNNGYRLVHKPTGDVHDFRTARQVGDFFWGRMDLNEFTIYKNRHRVGIGGGDFDRFVKRLDQWKPKENR